MARGSYTPEAARAARAVRFAVVALVVLIAVAAALYLTGRLGPTGVAAEDLSRVLLVAAAPDETGDVVAQIIAIADVSGSATTLEAVSPAASVTIPGTTYGTLADAYPFGGGAGVASALARARGGDSLPYVALNAAALTAALEEAGGVRITLPAPMSVFDGENLFTLSAGAQTLDPAEVGAVFKGAPYLEARDRTELDAELAPLVAALVADTGFEAVETDLSAEAYAALQSALAVAP
ncbi:MAG: hypothetical protein JXA36_05785 [Coriobacteriia bacterium]|nr:hypothetical protein [Coriobacteriia bacterium]